MKQKLLWWTIIIAFLPMMIFRDFTPDNEARYLSIADEALRNGLFFSFTLHGQPYADKPPFYFWLVMACRQLFGCHSMLALSMLSFLPAVGVVKVMNDWTRDSMSALYRGVAALMLFTTVYFAGATAVVRMDMLMCLFIVLALRSFWRLYASPHVLRSEQWLMGVWLFMALFTKGPLGLLIPLFCTLVFLLFNHRWRAIGRLWNWRTWAILVIGCVGWLSMTYYESGGDYLYNLVFHQTVDRSINSFHHAHAFYYYLISLWYEWLPWSFLCVGGIIWTVLRRQYLGEVYRFFFCIVITTLILLSCISSKLQIYLLPAIPFVIYLSASIIEPCKDSRWVLWALAIPEAVLMLSLPALLVAQHMVTLPLLRLPLIVVAAAVLSLFAAGSLYRLVAKKSVVISIQILGYGVLAVLFVVGWAMPMINPYIVK
ncbi:MAG: ArnT family glycosyltransferase [Prevotella sp.]|jgi:4-amino-4-deoxy-L-arabinose transferase-like glycosyltransferase